MNSIYSIESYPVAELQILVVLRHVPSLVVLVHCNPSAISWLIVPPSVNEEQPVPQVNAS